MEFKIEKKRKFNEDYYSREELDVAYSFAKNIYKEFGAILRAVVLFGSSARGTNKRTGDVDILLVVDDTAINLTPEMVEAYRIITEKTVVSTSNRIHVTTLKFTSFWDYTRVGDPIAINILRDGVALLDTGFFEPLQILLKEGKVRPTPEAVFSYYGRAPRSLFAARGHLLSATLELYWAVIDSAHAALMKLGEIPPSPEHVAALMEEKMVSQGLIERKYVTLMKQFYTLSKGIARREIKEVSGIDFEKYYREASDFVAQMKKIIDEKPPFSLREKRGWKRMKS
ncbi:MAG: nucleotidyltransferase domain-containing protein [Candidatus Woesearchaeota archaeon]|nr:nucleotidyltransferase domain-containing protein [Candidatus Woesearchaeota archaeon]